MIKNKRKGFTLTEMIIVIAVIIILAAILIPTFISLIRKSNMNSDIALAKNLNAAIEEYKEENGNKDLTFEEALKAAKLRGYILSSLNAKTNGFYFVWEDDTDQFILVEALLPNEAGNPQSRVEYSYKDGYGTMKKSWVFAIKDNKVVEKLENTHKYFGLATFLRVAPDFDSLNEFVNNNVGETIYVDSFDLSSGEGLVLNQSDQDVTINLEGASISTGKTDQGANAVNDKTIAHVTGGASLTVTGGEINGGGMAPVGLPLTFQIDPNSSLTLDGVKIDSSEIPMTYYAPKGANVTIKDCEITCGQGNQINGNVVYTGNTVVKATNKAIMGSTGCHITIESGTYIADQYTVAVQGTGIVEIKDGYFETKQANSLYLGTGSGTGLRGFLITGGMFKTSKLSTPKAFKELKASDWKTICNYGSECFIGRDPVTKEIVAVVICRYQSGSNKTVKVEDFLKDHNITIPNVQWGAKGSDY